MLSLFFLHWIADFIFQNRFISSQKCDMPLMMAIHCLIYGGVFYLVLHLSIWLVLFIIVTHYFIDHFSSCKDKLSLFEDQLLHLMVLGIVWGLSSF